MSIPLNKNMCHGSDFSHYSKGFLPVLQTHFHVYEALFPVPSRGKKPFNSVKSQDDSLLGIFRYIGSTTYTKCLFQHTFLIPVKKLFCPVIFSFLGLSHSQRHSPPTPLLAQTTQFLCSGCFFLFFKNLSLHLYGAYHHSTQSNSISANYLIFTTQWVGLLKQTLHCISNYGHLYVIA